MVNAGTRRAMSLRSLTYTSLARPDLGPPDFEAIHRTAQRENAARAITGLLIFNGTHFLQVLKGEPPHLAQLLDNLRRDPRHSNVQVRHDDPIEARSFPGWSMELLNVSPVEAEALDTVSERLPGGVADVVRHRIVRMTEAISR